MGVFGIPARPPTVRQAQAFLCLQEGGITPGNPPGASQFASAPRNSASSACQPGAVRRQ